MNKKCEVCLKIFKTFPSRVGRFCSYACNNKKKPGTFKKGYIGLRGKSNPHWSGGVAHHSSGYLYKHSPQHPAKDVRGYVLQHRLIMEKFIGRYLREKEVVHHVDGNKRNNKISNLILFKNQATHAQHHKIHD